MNTRQLGWVSAGIVALFAIFLLATKSLPINERTIRADQWTHSDGPVRATPPEHRPQTIDDLQPGRTPDGTSVRFKGAKLGLPIQVEDDGLDSPSTELMAEISADLSLIYGDLTRCEMIPKNSERLIVINGRAQKVEKTLSFSGGDVRRPKSHHGQFGLIAKLQGADTLLIPQPLLREYKTALAFRKANSVVIDAARSFVDAFNESSANPSAPNRSPENFWTQGSPNSNGLSKNAVSPQSRSETLRRPSLMSFRRPSKEEFEAFPQLPRESFLADAIVRTGDGKSTDYLPLVWVNGGWRIMLVSPGT